MMNSGTKALVALALIGGTVLAIVGIGRLQFAENREPPRVSVPAAGDKIDDASHSRIANDESSAEDDSGDDVVWADGDPEVESTADAKMAGVIAAMVQSKRSEETLASVSIDYPLDESIFPPDFVAPTFLWHDEEETLDRWLFEFSWDGDRPIYVVTPGAPPAQGEIDPRGISDTNEIYQPTSYQASAKAWTPDESLWSVIKGRSVTQPATITVMGFCLEAPEQARSRGRMTIRTAETPVGAPIFYRDVPLAPSQNEQGVIKPLSEASLPLIAWRLRDVSRPESRLLVTGLLTCTNCHSFSADGKTLGMDLDGPANDKGAYVIAPVARRTVIDQQHVISWNSFPDKPPGHKTLGFLARISPDGQYAMTTLNESVYVQNFTDYRFLQVFYPTRGILAYYHQATGKMKALPGADDPNYVHCNPVWSPDGQYLVFSRAAARDPYPQGYTPARYANDPAETQIQYDLFRIPFNDGQGGQAEPILGASNNGMSNSFPKISPDGKWIVFVQSRNGQLMRPDSTLWIVPAAGGQARRMRANTAMMNSWHSFSPNGRWLVFSSKVNTPYTQMFLTHLDDDGNDSPAILIPNSTAANRAVNLPEFVNIGYDDFQRIEVPAVQYLNDGMRGIQLFEKGRLDEALVEFQKAITAQPDYVEGHVSIAVIQIEKGLLDQALPHLQRALQLDPNSWFVHANLGIIAERTGRREQAIDHFLRAVELNPQHPTTRMNLGQALAESGKLEDALMQFRTAVDLAPEDPSCRLNLGNVLLELAQPQEASEHFRHAIQRHPQMVSARLGLGEALTQQGDFTGAIAQFRDAVQLAPSDLAALNGLAWLLATSPDDRLLDGSTALRLANTACQLTGYQDPRLLRTLAAAHAAAGQWSEAVNATTQALGILADHAKDPLNDQIRKQRQRYLQQRLLRFDDQ
jgi:Flp pilus assembly protein TadD